MKIVSKCVCVLLENLLMKNFCLQNCIKIFFKKCRKIILARFLTKQKKLLLNVNVKSKFIFSVLEVDGRCLFLDKAILNVFLKRLSFFFKYSLAMVFNTIFLNKNYLEQLNSVQ